MPAKRLAKSVAVQFGIELRNARATAKLTQQVLAERADIDPVFVSLLENGHRQPSLTVLLNLERVLGLDPGELSGRVAQALREFADAKRPNGTTRRR
jgi:transcriptional regulator with XRE-family HTH domain